MQILEKLIIVVMNHTSVLINFFLIINEYKIKMETKTAILLKNKAHHSIWRQAEDENIVWFHISIYYH